MILPIVVYFDKCVSSLKKHLLELFHLLISF